MLEELSGIAKETGDSKAGSERLAHLPFTNK